MSKFVVYLNAANSFIRVALPHARFLSLIASTVGSMVCAEAPANIENYAIYDISIAIGEPEEVPKTAKHIAEYPVLGGGRCTFGLDGEEAYLIYSDEGSLKINNARHCSSIVIHPDHEKKVAGNCLLLALESALDFSSQFILHAASLRLPNQTGNILIYAPSGAGKTTTSLSLLSQGFGLCADDATVLKIEGGVVTGWGFPRFLKVHENTVKMLPWLAPLFTDAWNHEGEQVLSRQNLSKIAPVVDLDTKPILGIFSLERLEGAQCFSEPHSLLEASVELIADNVRAGVAELLPLQERRLDGVLQLIDCVPSFKLKVGSDLSQVGQTILRALSLHEASG